MILIFCAPSGSGKSTFVKHLLGKYDNFELSISATSRSPRGTEKHGVEYYFLSADEFRRLIAEDKLIEYQEVYKDHFYGTLRSEIERIQKKGHHVVFDVDVKGGLNLKKIFGKEAVAVFIQPPSIEELRRRLEGRGTDSKEMIEQRLAKASTEMQDAPFFDHIIVNDKLETALADLEKLLHQYKMIN
ncbi:MAG: guanylate kinase [Paludibacteraceae bacterium]|nr:guanylate kinase [Paludibacteraceae bacterium]